MNKQQRLVIWISVLASFVAFLDGSVINVALPAMTRELGGGLTAQQWIVDSYMITLGSLMLIAGSLSDLLGRKRMLRVGLIGFAATSLLCAIAPNSQFLIIARALQGVFGAVLVPSSLALIISAFSGAAQGRAIGSWTGWTGIAFIVGPLLGGLFVDTSSWRLVFAINVIPIVITLILMHYLDQPDPERTEVEIDYKGAVLGVFGLGGPVYALIEQSHYGWQSPLIYGPFVVGIILFALFIRHEQRTNNPMLPLDLFHVRNFTAGNVATFAIYAGLSTATFLIAVFVQQVGGYSATAAGMALLPVTFIMMLLSSRFGALAGRHGPRLFMTFGPVLAGIGFLLMLRVDSSVAYWTQLFPGIALFGFGLSMTVAPLTSAVLGSIRPAQAGIGSAVNNAVSRIAGLVAIAALGLVIGSQVTLASFHRGIIATAVLCILGGIISYIGIRNAQVVKPL
ncbi:MAG: transporter [Candidatus Saccharibacteria bacterium]|nr:transporter [Candidatus Saccharibacteria bacterium]